MTTVACYRAMYIMDRETAHNIFSYTGLIFNILLYIVPLFQLPEVWRTGVIEVFPLPLACASAISCMLWTYYSWIKWSPIYCVASALGVFFNGLQVLVVISVYLTFGGKVLEKCEVERSGRLASNKVPFFTTNRRSIDLREAKALLQEAKQRAEMERLIPPRSCDTSSTQDTKRSPKKKNKTGKGSGMGSAPTEKTSLLSSTRL